MIGQANIRTFTSVTLLLLFATVALVALTTTSTTGPIRAHAATSTLVTKPVTGTITNYNAGSHALTVKDASGATQSFTLSKVTQIVKSQKITAQQLGPLVATNGILVAVTVASSSVNITSPYTAQQIIVSNIARPTSRTPITGKRAAGTPSAASTPNPGSTVNTIIVVIKGKVQNNQLIGQNTLGKTVTVNFSDTTPMFNESTGTTSDLKSGLNVKVTGKPAARQILVGDLPTNG